MPTAAHASKPCTPSTGVLARDGIVTHGMHRSSWVCRYSRIMADLHPANLHAHLEAIVATYNRTLQVLYHSAARMHRPTTAVAAQVGLCRSLATKVITVARTLVAYQARWQLLAEAHGITDAMVATWDATHVDDALDHRSREAAPYTNLTGCIPPPAPHMPTQCCILMVHTGV